MTRKSLHLVINPKSGAFVRGLDADDLRRRIADAGWDIVGESDPVAGDFDISGDADIVAIAGGDGTVMHVLDALAGRSAPPPALVLPCGTANLLARRLHGSIDLDRVLAEGHDADVTELALGSVNGRPFAVAAAIGVSPALVKVREDLRGKGWSGRMGRVAAHVAAGWRSFFRGRLYVALGDDGPPRRVTALYVTCPEGLDETALGVFAGRLRSVADLAGGLAKAAIPVLPDSDAVWRVDVPRLQVMSRRDVPVILDGEPVRLESPLTLELGAVKVKVLTT